MKSHLIIDEDDEDRETKYSSSCTLACLAAKRALETSDGNNEFCRHRTINLNITNSYTELNNQHANSSKLTLEERRARL